MGNIDTNYTIVKNDSPWRVAEKNLKKSGKQQITNKDIVAEMRRLAKINNCNSVEEFGKKYFRSLGKVIKMDESKETILSASSNYVATILKVPKAFNDTTTKVVNDSIDIKIKNIPNLVSADTARVDTLSAPYKVSADTTVAKFNKPVSIEEEVQNINNMENDLTRILQYNKKHYNGKYYGVVDKKSCELVIYSKEGKEVKRFAVGIGKTKGDGLSNYYADRHNRTDNAWKAEYNRYTTPGEFTLDDQQDVGLKGYTGTDGKQRIMQLKGDNRGVNSGQISLHVVYNNEASRIKGIKSATTSDNRMSYGCVNLLQEDYDLMHQYLEEGDKVFVLPEEKGNKLQLEKQADGTYVFHQQYHKDDKRDMTVAQASKVNYDIAVNRDPARQRVSKQSEYVAKQTEQKGRFIWYNPTTWFA